MYFRAGVISRNAISKLPLISEKWAVQTLNVSHTEIGDDELTSLLPEASNLYVLEMNNTPASDRSLEAISKHKVPFRNIQAVGTSITTSGVKALATKIEPKWITMSFAEDKAKELNGFLRAHKIKTTVLMLDSPIGEEDGKGRSVWLGYEGVTHKMSDGEIRGEVGELLRIEADNEAFLPKKMKN